MKIIGLSIVIGADDVRMTYSGAVLGLTQESFDSHRILRQTGAQDLHRSDAALRVLGAVYRRGPALAYILGKVVASDGPASQHVAIHRVAKLVLSPRGSK